MTSTALSYVEVLARFVGAVKAAVDDYNVNCKDAPLLLLAPLLTPDHMIDELRLVRDIQALEPEQNSRESLCSTPSKNLDVGLPMAGSVTFEVAKGVVSNEIVCSSPENPELGNSSITATVRITFPNSQSQTL
ncbi:uncharacterized protein CTRU02_200201 [Colletotrichum truncatum]|uniref:Uncharacterized protein n=1 Tax=Colletotrichum truncatum TaxID=5467 RepID=A0ACC3ZE74_COLTU